MADIGETYFHIYNGNNACTISSSKNGSIVDAVDSIIKEVSFCFEKDLNLSRNPAQIEEVVITHVETKLRSEKPVYVFLKKLLSGNSYIKKKFIEDVAYSVSCRIGGSYYPSSYIVNDILKLACKNSRTVLKEFGIQVMGGNGHPVAKSAVKAGSKSVLGGVEKTAGKTVAKTIFKRAFAILGPVTAAWGYYDILSGKDFPVHSGGIYKAETELTSTQYSEKEHDDALELYNRLNAGKGNIKNFKSYPIFFVYIKFAKDERIQNMPPRKIKAMIDITIICINEKRFASQDFKVDDAIKAFDDFEKMNRLFGK